MENLEEREEGEIIDEFDDVSDCSMSLGSPISSGKSLSPPIFSDVCSVSSVEFEDCVLDLPNTSPVVLKQPNSLYYPDSVKYVNGDLKRTVKNDCVKTNHGNHHYKLKRTQLDSNHSPCIASRHPRKHHRRKHSSLPDNQLSNSEDEGVDPKFAKQLREALHRESSQDLLHNSLRSRLKGFIEPTSQSDDELILRDKALMSTNKNKNETEVIEKIDLTQEDRVEEKNEDSELQELRIAALKSFVIENHKKRKRKAAEPQTEEDKKDEVNKENEISCVNNNVTEIKKANEEIPKESVVVNEQKNCNEDLSDDDIDILRTHLLASMSKKLVQQNVIESKVQTSKNLSSKKPSAVPNVKRPLIKPIVRTIRNDFCDKKKKVYSALLDNIVVKPLVISVNNDSDSDVSNDAKNSKSDQISKSVAQFLKHQRAQVEQASTIQPIGNTKKLQPVNSNNVLNEENFLDKSGVKLLPRSQQLEYRQLKLKLLNAKKQKRLIQSNAVSSGILSANLKKLPSASNLKEPSVVNSFTKVSKETLQNIQISAAVRLDKALNEMQIKKNGRFQMKGKYRPLATLLSKINKASNERTVQGKVIKNLLYQLQQAKHKLSLLDINFSTQVSHLINKKNVIDQRIARMTKTSTKTIQVTASKVANNIEKKLIATNHPKNNELNNEVTSTDKLKSVAIGENVGPIQLGFDTPTDEEVLLEPKSDFDQLPIATKQLDDDKADSLPKYISPLDNVNRTQIADPHALMCPYDLFGVCKDKECAYVHCL